MERLIGQTDVIVTDSPLMLSRVYSNPDSAYFHELNSLIDVIDTSLGESINLVLFRQHAYSTAGRSQTEEQADEIHKKVMAYLRESHRLFFHIESSEEQITSFCNYFINTHLDK